MLKYMLNTEYMFKIMKSWEIFQLLNVFKPILMGF